jgi:predicted AAA+ superfamily ATPase
MEFVSRFFDIPKQSFFLFGPRGTGKSTLLRRSLPDALYLDLLDPALHRALSARPERIGEFIQGSPQANTVIVDEVQRVPEILTVVHALLERAAAPRFVLTGSSARKLRRGGVDLLAGRALNLSLHPFMAAELPGFQLSSALMHGMVPMVVGSTDPVSQLQAYASLYLEEEVRTEGLTRNVGAFARFLEVMSFSHASLLNIANVARECEVERKTVAGYVEILEDLLLAFRLPVFGKRAQRKKVAHPKFYFFDAGVFRYLRPRGPLDRVAEMEGPALEGLVAQHLRAWAAYSRQRIDLSFWRTQGGSEVDFVAYGENIFCAIEVKNSAHVQPADLRGLRAFKEEYPEARLILAYRGKQRRKIGETWCLPVEKFLRALRPGHGLDDELGLD